jgi:hypothetical protein
MEGEKNRRDAGFFHRAGGVRVIPAKRLAWLKGVGQAGQAVQTRSPGAAICIFLFSKTQKARSQRDRAFVFNGCLTMSYFRTGNPHYHRR